MANIPTSDEFRLPVFATLKDIYSFLWSTQRDLVLIAAFPIVALTVYRVAAIDLFGAIEPASTGGPRPPTLWDVFILYLPSMLLYTMFAVAWHRRYLMRGEATTVWSALRWDVRKTRFLFRSILIWLIAVAIVMTIIARRTRFGRYIFATGGNPDAAELSGINTRLLTVKIFTLLGVLCAISAVVASSRLTYHSNDIGVLDELRVIAAAVIGGTALKGGVGTIYGAIIGALIMQSLQSGMAMVGVDAPLQNIVVGAVLVAAVLIDIWYRRRIGSQD